MNVFPAKWHELFSSHSECEVYYFQLNEGFEYLVWIMCSQIDWWVRKVQIFFFPVG